MKLHPMDIIKNNPYRILGLLAGATAKEQNRQISRLKQYIEAEQEPPTDDFSFSALGEFSRTTESLEEAASKLNLDEDKVNAALFWFWNGNPITDEVAFDALRDGDVDKAYEIWDDLVVENQEDGKRFWRQLTKKNASAFHNLFVLETIRKSGNKHNAIVSNLYFLQSEFSQDFISNIADSTYKISAKEVQSNFLINTLNEIEQRTTNLTFNKFLTILNATTFITKEDFLKSISQKITSSISDKIEITKNKRNANKSNADNAGNELFQEIKDDLEKLTLFLNKDDFTYSNIADKVAEEILQCSIDYFNHCQSINSRNDYEVSAMKLAELADNLAVGNLVKKRIEENIKTLVKMKNREIKQAIDLLKSVSDAYNSNRSKITTEAMSMTLGRSQTINWNKLEEIIENSIDWRKVVELIKETITLQDIEKIKNTYDLDLIEEYKSLVNFLFQRLNYQRRKEIKFLAYWDENKYQWYNNPRNWKDFGGWWWDSPNTGDAQFNGCLSILMLPLNLVSGSVFLLYRGTAWLFSEINKSDSKTT